MGKQPIQRGVYYNPDVDFYAFDIQLHPKEVNAQNFLLRKKGEPHWMNYHESLKLFVKHGFFHAKPLRTGSIAHCFEFDIKIDSTVPKLLSLPPLSKNQMEGIIIKSVDPNVLCRVHNLTVTGSSSREKRSPSPNFQVEE